MGTAEFGDTGAAPSPALSPPGLSVALSPSPSPLRPRSPRWPQGTMNVLAPVRRDRIIADLPQVTREGTTALGWPP